MLWSLSRGRHCKDGIVLLCVPWCLAYVLVQMYHVVQKILSVVWFGYTLH